MARQLDPNGQSLYARFSRYLSEGDDRLDQDMIREVDAPPAVHDPEPVPPSAPFPPVAEGVKTRHTRVATVAYQLIAMLLTAAISLLLIWTTAKLPSFGDAQNPAHNEVARRYVENGMEETGSVNLVTGMILDYRAFDTLGESHVLFTALVCVMVLLRKDWKNMNSKLRKSKLMIEFFL